MRCACIDIGSNTTRLLVAEPDGTLLHEVLSQRAFTHLRGYDQAIPVAKIAEVACEVAAQVELARDAGAERIEAVATAAIRYAANRDELCAAIEAASGIGVRVLSEEAEARLAFLGAVGTLDRAPDGVVAVVDVGGGSTEIVFGTAEAGVSWWTSFRVGSGVLADSFLGSDPPREDELELVRAHVAATFDGVEMPPADVAYAVGGSATSLRRLIGAVLDAETLDHGVRTLCGGCAAELAPRHELHLERIRVLPAGMLVLEGASGALGLPLTIAGGGLREGVILELQHGVAA
jgi:exopolyphosphatase/guanosine-5'-triphosphate,3'-diphosphate pyrophosphatase